MARLKNPMHGGNVYAAARELGCRPTALIDFSASINPLGPSPHVWKAITQARDLLLHYPDPDCWDLRQALARCWDIDSKHIVVGNGSTELIDVLPRTLGIDRLLVVRPTFSEYEAAMVRVGGRVTALYAKREEQYVVPIDQLCRDIERKARKSDSVDGVLLCNPNSPTGQAYTSDDVRRIAQAARRRGMWVVIDEAFVDYCPERSVLPQASSWPRAVVLRSMTKFYALPGLRVGYAVAAPATIRLLQRQLSPWSVSAMGQVAALAALQDETHAEKSLHFMAEERPRLAALLATLPGCVTIPTYANYFFVELPRKWRARSVTEQLRREGLLIRDCSSVPGAHPCAIRLAVRTQRENDQLVSALSEILHGQVV